MVVCPTHSIWVGDLDDPTSGIARLVSTQRDRGALTGAGHRPERLLPRRRPGRPRPAGRPCGRHHELGEPDGSREIAGDLTGRLGEHNARTTVNTAHPRPWGWKVATYLWTKSIAAGALRWPPLALRMGVDADGVSGSRPR